MKDREETNNQIKEFQHEIQNLRGQVSDLRRSRKVISAIILN